MVLELIPFRQLIYPEKNPALRRKKELKYFHMLEYWYHFYSVFRKMRSLTGD